MLDFNNLKNQDSDSQIVANEAAARALDLPDIASLPRPNPPHLAIVSGGNSISKRVNALRNWRGDVWATNNAALWCVQHKIRCTMFSIDSSDKFNPEIRGNVKAAILSARCHPYLFGLLREAKVAIFDLPPSELGPGSTASACLIATRFCGYTNITFFGCEGCYSNKQYAYDPIALEDPGILVECNGEVFRTVHAWLFATRAIAYTIRQFPSKVSERSGGLLAAMVKSPDCRIVGISPQLATPKTSKVLVDNYLAHVQ